MHLFICIKHVITFYSFYEFQFHVESGFDLKWDIYSIMKDDR